MSKRIKALRRLKKTKRCGKVNPFSGKGLQIRNSGTRIFGLSG